MTVVDFAIWLGDQQRILVQRRSPTRRLYPGCWELPGGHLEPGETIEQCIRRELAEECNMALRKIWGEAYRFTWPENPEIAHLIYLISARGHFRPEADKISDYRWISSNEVDILLRPEETTNGIFEGAVRSFALGELAR